MGFIFGFLAGLLAGILMLISTVAAFIAGLFWNKKVFDTEPEKPVKYTRMSPEEAP